MKGKFSRSLDEKLVDKEQFYWRLKFGNIKGGKQSKTEIPHDQALSKNYFKKKIVKEGTGSKCRLYEEDGETTDRLTSGCPIFAKNKYIIRHDKILCKETREPGYIRVL